MLSEVSDETLISEIQDIFQNSNISHIGGDLSTSNYVWDTNINAYFEPFGKNTQSSYYKRNNYSFNFMFYHICAR